MNRKFRNIMMFIYVLSLAVMLAGATFAYFTYIKVSSVSPIVEAQTATVGNIIFNINNSIDILVNGKNFAKGMPSISSESSASATLIVNGEKEYKTKYNLYLEIEENPFIYTSLDNTPEIIMSIIDPLGNEVTEIDGLSYSSVTDGTGKLIKGFDITTKTQRVNIANAYEIKTMNETTQIWKVQITFVNLETDQAENTPKEFDGYLKMEKVV